MGPVRRLAEEVRPAPDYSAPAITIQDNVLAPDSQQAMLDFLRGPGWGYGAFSDPAPDASRYWYKHFAGYVQTGQENRDPDQIDRELEGAAPLAAEMWRQIQPAFLPGQRLTRCYANGYPFGSEGGLHMDSNIPSHCTVIYYPHQAWHPNFGGETLFFNAAGDEIIAAVYPRPNRLVVFSGTIPHVARPISRKCPDLRITLMFKTAPQ